MKLVKFKIRSEANKFLVSVNTHPNTGNNVLIKCPAPTHRHHRAPELVLNDTFYNWTKVKVFLSTSHFSEG